MLSSFIEMIFLPPWGLIWLLVTIFLILLWSTKTSLKVLGVACSLMIIALSLPISSNFLMTLVSENSPISLTSQSPENKQSSQPANFDPQSIDAIVVLGGGHNETFDLSGNRYYFPADQAQHRLNKAAEAYQLIQKPILVSEGVSKFVRTPPGAKSMAAYLQNVWKIPEVDIVLESSALNTWQNAQRSLELAQQLGFKHILLITDDWHMKRAIWSFNRSILLNHIPNIKISSLAVRLIRAHPVDEGMFKWVPQFSAFTDSQRAMREIVGLWYYQLRY